MEWSKLKNIILIMLACVNLFLLVLVIHRQWESRELSAQAREDAVAVLWENGRIRLDSSALPREMDLSAMAMVREPEQTQAQAAALLGELYEAPLDSMRYEGAKGTAQFYVDGEFSAEFTPGAYPLEGAEPGSFAVAVLAGMGFDAEVLEVAEAAGETAVTVRQLAAGAPVFDCTAVLVFRDGELREIEKTVSYRLVGKPRPAAGQNTLDLVTLLLRFMDYVNQTNPGCGEISSFTAGYTLDAQSEPAQLVPTWRVVTDLDTEQEAAYYWNAVTGEIRPE